MQSSPDATAPWVALYTREAPRRGDRPSLLEAFRATAGQRPSAAFIRYFDGAISYGEAAAHVEAIAAHFRGAGIGAGDRVALILQNVPDFALVALASWTIGAVIVPVNPMYRQAELARLFADATPRAIVCHGDNLDTVRGAAAAAAIDAMLLVSAPRSFQAADDDRILPRASPHDAGPLAIDMIHARSAGAPAPIAPRAGDARDLALILYTSGTTGMPKGARLTHANIAHVTGTVTSWFALDAASRILAMAPLFHITGLIVHFTAAVMAGGELVLAYRFQPEVMLDAMVAHRPTFTIAPITAYFALRNVPTASADHFASFATLCTGGAPAPAPAVEDFRKAFGRPLLNGYGMTELCSASHFCPVGRDAPVDPESGALSIGVPMFDVEAKIVDEDGVALPAGQTGELWIRGPLVMEGYWQRPIETAEALHDGWMRTGDVAKMDEDGWFFLIDRKRDMIIASGFKVWPREVEDVLYAHPAVMEAAVVGVPDAYRGETVKAVVTLKAGRSAEPAELIAHCRDLLAAYKVPRIVEIIGDMPKTLTGKIIRAALRDVTPT